MTKTNEQSPRGLRDHFAAIRAYRHLSSAIDSTGDAQGNLEEILFAEDQDAAKAIDLVKQAYDLLIKAQESADRSIAASKRR